jgi:hypothetical protein
MALKQLNACAIGAVDGKVQEVISLFEGKRGSSTRRSIPQEDGDTNSSPWWLEKEFRALGGNKK